jgi:hypothetical protein
VKPFRDGLVVGAECMFAWYWLADLCEDETIPFVLGHALYMKAIHGGKAKSDKIDAGKLAALLRGGLYHLWRKQVPFDTKRFLNSQACQGKIKTAGEGNDGSAPERLTIA